MFRICSSRSLLVVYELEYEINHFFILYAAVLVVRVHLDGSFQPGKAIPNSDICDVFF
jgi:hypothetical protein